MRVLRLNLRKVAMIFACLVVTAIFASCDKKNDDEGGGGGNNGGDNVTGKWTGFYFDSRFVVLELTAGEWIFQIDNEKTHRGTYTLENKNKAELKYGSIFAGHATVNSDNERQLEFWVWNDDEQWAFSGTLSKFDDEGGYDGTPLAIESEEVAREFVLSVYNTLQWISDRLDVRKYDTPFIIENSLNWTGNMTFTGEKSYTVEAYSSYGTTTKITNLTPITYSNFLYFPKEGYTVGNIYSGTGGFYYKWYDVVYYPSASGPTTVDIQCWLNSGTSIKMIYNDRIYEGKVSMSFLCEKLSNATEYRYNASVKVENGKEFTFSGVL